ncbi:LGFP repeat-containing protein, partial [Rhodococcoides kroppenstedtii]|uniref:LGFP repeat-containing protein n=1 Tax=Rhodococcoides kroppenstedtii TaxID=293050 RepID=UPI0036295204
VSFQNAIGSAIRNGPIRDKWNAIGGNAPGGSFLGYLTEDHKRTLPDGQGQMARFQNGVIYWHPTHGAHWVNGRTLTIWSQAGYEGGEYGSSFRHRSTHWGIGVRRAIFYYRIDLYFTGSIFPGTCHTRLEFSGPDI